MKAKVAFIQFSNFLSPRKSFEKLAHCYEIQLIRAIENNCLNSQSLSQIFCCFCLSCSCWARRSSSKFQVQSSC